MKENESASGSASDPASSPSTEDPVDVRARLAAIVDSSEDAVVGKTLKGIVTSWNAAAERLFGWTSEEMIGQPILKLIPEDLQHEEAEILAKLRAGERIERYETIRRHKSGRRLHVSLTVSPIRDRNGVIVGAAKIAHDVTARRQAERTALEEARALETLNRVGQAVATQLELERIVQIVTDAATEISSAAFGAFFYNVTEHGKDSYWLYTRQYPACRYPPDPGRGVLPRRSLGGRCRNGLRAARGSAALVTRGVPDAFGEADRSARAGCRDCEPSASKPLINSRVTAIVKN
jgi:PAS domain S-box-containing protein